MQVIQESFTAVCLLFGVGIVFLLGLWVPIMDIDAAQYAAIAAEMVYSGEYLEIYDRGQDYLDKPPLVFWSAAAAYQILGIHPVVSKLGTLLFTLLAIYSTSRLAAFLYGGRTGQLAFYLMASVEAVFLVSNDVRTDGLLLGSVTFAMWQLTVFSRTGSTRALILGAFGAGFGMLAKGPIGVVVPVLALGSDAFLRRDWQLLFRRQWLLVPVLVLVILSPMMWGLWTQHGWGGLQFYFWTQSFGRITGERALSDSTTVVYFLHTIIWAFFPWTPVLAYALMRRVRDIEWVRLRSYTERTEFLTFGGFVLTFFALSLSQYKLPHYIYVTFPFGVIMCAQVLSQLDLTVPRALTVAQGLFLGVGWIAVGLTALAIFPVSFSIAVMIAAALLVTVYIAFRSESVSRLVLCSLATSLALNFYMNAWFLPELLVYQSSIEAGRKMHALAESTDLVAGYKIPWSDYSLDVYARRVVRRTDSLEELKEWLADDDGYIYTSHAGLSDIQGSGWPLTQIDKFDHYKVSRVSPRFLDPVARRELLKKRYLLLLIPEEP